MIEHKEKPSFYSKLKEKINFIKQKISNFRKTFNKQITNQIQPEAQENSDFYKNINESFKSLSFKKQIIFINTLLKIRKRKPLTITHPNGHQIINNYKEIKTQIEHNHPELINLPVNETTTDKIITDTEEHIKETDKNLLKPRNNIEFKKVEEFIYKQIQ